jgi:hypothetical protein
VWGDSHVALNLGALVDPAVVGERATGMEGGLDLALAAGVPGLSIMGELGGVHFFSPDADQLHATAGVGFSPSDWLDLSAIGLVGLLPAGDRLGLLLGVSPKFALWK